MALHMRGMLLKQVRCRPNRCFSTSTTSVKEEEKPEQSQPQQASILDFDKAASHCQEQVK